MAALVFDPSVLSQQDSIPAQLLWPAEEAPAGGGVEEIDIPAVDLAEFLRGGGELPRGVAEACERHGFFQVVSHGVDPALLGEVYRCLDAFYARPLSEKQRAQRRVGETHGYASSFTGRFDCKLPWKETLSFNCPADAPRAVVDYFIGVLGEEDRHMGYVREMFFFGRFLSLSLSLSCALFVGTRELSSIASGQGVPSWSSWRNVTLRFCIALVD
jgi:gibberellin-44 dioxygenase